MAMFFNPRLTQPIPLLSRARGFANPTVRGAPFATGGGDR